MKAMRFTEAGKPLELAEVAEPEPGPGWVVVDVEAAGLCHSDLHILHGPGTAWLDKIPITLGHEVAGTVAALGEGVTAVALGDRVGVANLSHPADRAQAGYVRSGPGLEVDGGYAEKCLVHASTLVVIPDEVSFAAAAVATDAIGTAYHAVRTAGELRAGQVVGVVGLGGLGINGVRAAALCGAHVYGVDVNPATFESARAAGARECFADVADLAALQPDLIVDFAGVGSTTEAALRAVRFGGLVVLVGLGSDTRTIPTQEFVITHKTLRGSVGLTKDELRQVYGFLAVGEFTPVVEEVPFDDLNHAFDRLERGDVRGRLVTRPRGQSTDA